MHYEEFLVVLLCFLTIKLVNDIAHSEAGAVHKVGQEQSVPGVDVVVLFVLEQGEVLLGGGPVVPHSEDEHACGLEQLEQRAQFADRAVHVLDDAGAVDSVEALRAQVRFYLFRPVIDCYVGEGLSRVGARGGVDLHAR